MLIIKLLSLYYVLFGLFHLFFWRLLNWKEQLIKSSPVNQAVVQTLNICLTFMFFLVGFCLYDYPEEIVGSGLGNALLIGMGLFWIIRAILQLYLFEMKQTIHKVLFVIFGIGIVLHYLPYLI